MREALLRLLSEGLAAETPSGLVVRRLTEEEIMEIYEVRIPLEATCARLATGGLSLLNLARLDALGERLAAAAGQDGPPPQWVGAATLEFHRVVCQAARNALLLDFMSKIYDSLTRFRQTVVWHPGRLTETVVEHEGILAAMKDGDADRAERLMRDHVERGKRVRLEMYSSALEAGPSTVTDRRT